MNGSDNQDKSKELGPPPRPSSRPTRIKSADPNSPHIRAKSELLQKLENLDKPNAASNPDTTCKFEEVRDQLNEEGLGGPMAASLRFPALGPQKTYLLEGRPIPTEASTKKEERDATLQSIKDIAGSSNTNMEVSSTAEFESEPQVSVEQPTGICAQQGSAERTQEDTLLTLQTTIANGIESKESCASREGSSDSAFNFTIDVDLPCDERPLDRKLSFTKQELFEEKIPPQRLSEHFSDPQCDRGSTKDRDETPESPRRDSAQELTSSDVASGKTCFASKISPKSSKKQVPLENLSKYSSIEIEDEQLSESKSSEPVNSDSREGASITSERLSVASTNDECRNRKSESESAEITSSTTSAVPEMGSRPNKPLAPKPKSAIASRFEAALQEYEESKSKIVPKPKPRLGGSGGRIGALQASMFADLNAALSRGPLPNGRPRASIDAEKSSFKTEDGETEPQSRDEVSSRDSAEDQIKAMSMLPTSRAAGPSRRRRLPENAKPKCVIVSHTIPLWEILEPATQTSSVKSLPSHAGGSDESDLERYIGSNTELNLKDALVWPLSRSDINQSSDSQSERSESFKQAIPTSANASTVDEIMTNLCQLSQRGLPSLGSLVDRSPSPVTTLDHGTRAGSKDIADDTILGNTTQSESTGLLNMKLSQKLDKRPQTFEISPRSGKMEAADLESQGSSATQPEEAVPGIYSAHNTSKDDSGSIKRENFDKAVPSAGRKEPVASEDVVHLDRDVSFSKDKQSDRDFSSKTVYDSW